MADNTRLGKMQAQLNRIEAQINDQAVTLVVWGWDCIDCAGDFGANDCCDSCGGTNRIPLYATEDDAAKMEAVL